MCFFESKGAKPRFKFKCPLTGKEAKAEKTDEALKEAYRFAMNFGSKFSLPFDEPEREPAQVIDIRSKL